MCINTYVKLNKIKNELYRGNITWRSARCNTEHRLKSSELSLIRWSSELNVIKILLTDV